MPRRTNPDGYSNKKDRDNARNRKKSQKARDIGPLPVVADPARRARCSQSLREHCLTYYPQKFYLPFSPDHLIAIDRLEKSIRFGSLAAIAFPRGSGKSELCKRALEWAILNGYRKFVMIVAANEKEAVRLSEDIKETFASNDLLAADYPEACHAVRKLEGIVHRAKGQLLDGRSTKLVWKENEIRLARIPGAACSGAIMRTVGITGAIRGATATGADGGSVRPDLVLLDDCQDRESATSPLQTEERERIIRGDVLGLAGPTTTIAAVMTCTVIAENDLAERFLDREKSPQWHGIRCKLVKSFPVNQAAWDRYFDLRIASLRAGGDGSEATAYYRENRRELDEGVVMAWQERYNAKLFASAVEEAMVKRQENPIAFQNEMQNEPCPEFAAGTVRELSSLEIANRLNNIPRYEVPRECTRLTAFVDVGKQVHWYAIVGWDETFGGGIVDVGSYPKQNRAYFSGSDARPSLEDMYPGYTDPQLVFAGLRDLTNQILGRSYLRQETGEELRIGLCLIDSGWETDTVYQFCRQSPHAAIIHPSKGYATEKGRLTVDEWPRRSDEQAGLGWRLGPVASGRGRIVKFDTYKFKSLVADRLVTPPGGGGALQLFGSRPDTHHLLADHLSAEYGKREPTNKGSIIEKWYEHDGRENHLFDCVVGAAVAASVRGLVFSAARAVGEQEKPVAVRKRPNMKEWFAKAKRTR